MEKIRGVFTVLVTPFTKENEVHEDLFRQLIQFQIAAGVNGITVLGTTGEAPTLSAREKEKIIRIAREETLGKTHLMVGTGSYSTVNTIENTLLAKSLGADSALIVTPYYNKPTQEGLYLHYKSITDSVDIPIMIYNVQVRTSQNITTDTLIRIAQLPYVCGVKEASGNLSQIMEVIEKIGRKYSHFSVMSGDDSLTLPCAALGGDGILSVVSNLIPIQICALTNHALSGDFTQARDLHHALMPIFRGAFIETNPIPIKAAMELAGWAVGQCRLPLCSLSKDNEVLLKKIVNETNMIRLIKNNLTLYHQLAKYPTSILA
jgi:4-hydroxy-tetrahydrodipicolinate synthase